MESILRREMRLIGQMLFLEKLELALANRLAHGDEDHAARIAFEHRTVAYIGWLDGRLLLRIELIDKFDVIDEFEFDPGAQIMLRYLADAIRERHAPANRRHGDSDRRQPDDAEPQQDRRLGQPTQQWFLMSGRAASAGPLAQTG